MEPDIVPVQIRWEDINYTVKLGGGKYYRLYQINI